MIPYLRSTCLAAGLVAIAAPAAAQTWVYENGPRAWAYEPSYGYSAAPTQRTTVDRTIIPQGNGRAPIVRERVVTENYGAAAVIERPAAPVTAYAYAPRGYSEPVVDSYAYVPRRTYVGPAYDSYAYVPRRAYEEPVVESYYYVPRPPAAVGESYAYVGTAPAPAVAGPRWVYERNSGSCAQRYRSYDPASRTFLGYDGRRHPCP
jgi:hypothetical protein